MHRFVWAFVALLAALSNTAHAQEPLRLTPAERELAFDLARVAMNEAGTEEDLALIWQIVQQHGETPRARRAWLRAHSPCATGVLPQAQAMRRPGRCRWVRHLFVRQHSAPQGFERPSLWPRTRERWYQMLRWAAEHVAGRRILVVCSEAPTTWDGRRWREAILERGFEILDCKGTANFGLRRPQPSA